MHMAEQYCFLGWLHRILRPFILPTLKQWGTVKVRCSCSLFKPWSASLEAVPLNNGKQNRSLGLSAGTFSMQHCINAVAIIPEWREKQNVQLKLCLVHFLRELTTREKCQIEGSGKHSWEGVGAALQASSTATRQLNSACRCSSLYVGSRVLLGGRKSESSHLFTAWSPSWHLHSHLALYIYDEALWLLLGVWTPASAGGSDSQECPRWRGKGMHGQVQAELQGSAGGEETQSISAQMGAWVRWGALARPLTACSHTAPSSSPIPGPIATIVLGQGKPPGGAEVAKTSSCPWQQDSGLWQELHLCPAGFGGENVIAHSWKRSWRAFPFLCDVTDLHIFSLDTIFSRWRASLLSLVSQPSPASPNPPI